MFFLNLTIGQFLVLFGSASAVTLALYLMDRSRRRVVVPTLKFWVAAEQPVASSRRKRIRQPVSLLLQLIGLLLLLLAIAQLRFGGRAALPAQHVILLDTSAWMAARAAAPGTTLMDEVRERARAYVDSLPARDLVMVVRADGLATPGSAFETSRSRIDRAIGDSKPGATALNLERAFAFAQQAQQLAGRRGEITYIGPARIAESAEVAAPANLRVIPIEDAAQNVGLRRVGLRRSAADPGLWEVYVSVRNYGATPREGTLLAGFDGAPVGSKRLTLPPQADREAVFAFRSQAKGVLDVRLGISDSYPNDNRAVLEVPAMPALQVNVYSDAPDVLRPIFAASPHVNAVFRSVAEYRADTQGLVILDRFRPRLRPATDTVWLAPPASDSPIPVKTQLSGLQPVRWAAGEPLSAGLRTRDVRVESPLVFAAAAGDRVVAAVDAGPVVLIRPGEHRTIAIGFEPASSGLRYELATPLLFANILRWVAPTTFREPEMLAQPVGTVQATLDAQLPPEAIKVTREDGTAVPFSVRDRSLHFFAGERGKIRVTAGDREQVYSLSLPEMWDTRWEPPATVRKGVPRRTAGLAQASSYESWPLFALLGAGCFVAEWLLYGRVNRPQRRAVVTPLRPIRRVS